VSKQNGLSAGHLRPLETSLRALGKMLTGRWLGLRRSRSPIAEDSRTLQDESFRPNLKYCVPALAVGLAVTLGRPLVRVPAAGSRECGPTPENESGPSGMKRGSPAGVDSYSPPRRTANLQPSSSRAMSITRLRSSSVKGLIYLAIAAQKAQLCGPRSEVGRERRYSK
jgi:hypothetical protein